MDRITLKQSLTDLESKLETLTQVLNPDAAKKRIEELDEKTADPTFWSNAEKARKVISEQNDLKDKCSKLDKLKSTFENLSLILEMSDEDESLLEETDDEIKTFDDLYDELEIKLMLSDESDKMNAIIDIHSGAGGTESNDWAQMLFRMYQMYCQKNKYKMQVLDFQEGEEVGIKSVSFRVEGDFAYGYLKSESGVHRLVRLSPFDSDHARHTTFASVLVTPEVTDDIDIKINEEDLRIDVFHSSGAGGQGVNTTDSAVRVTHLPTKIVVTCQNERSQIQNKETAIKVLKSRLYSIELEKRKEEMDKLNNKMQISFGAQIRSYVFHPYTLVKDHRTNFETSQGQKVMDGDIQDFINAYLKYKGTN